MRRRIVDNNMGAEGCDRVSGKIVRVLVKALICGDQWFGAPGMQKVVYDIGLRQDSVPHLKRHAGIS